MQGHSLVCLRSSINKRIVNKTNPFFRPYVTENVTRPGFFTKDRMQAPANFNRWKMVIPAVATHLSLGSVFAWSIFNELLIKENGIIVSSAGDWNLPIVVPVFSTILACHGISAALLAKWQEDVGPRLSGFLGAFAFGGGIMLGGLGALMQNIYLLYLGYGILGGLGMGLAYVPPVATLIRWFPDRRGLATGLTIMGFGGGALVTTFFVNYLVKAFKQPPQFLGSMDSLDIITQGGRQFVQIGDSLREVVVATAHDVASSQFQGLQEGVYLVGTGSTGAGMTLLALGAGYLVTMLASSLSYRTPPPNYTPAGWVPPKNQGMVSTRNVDFSKVLKTRQFWQIWVAFGSLSSAGMATVSVAKTMMSEIFSKSLPLIVTPQFCNLYIMFISVANLMGRLIWSAASDSLGRKRVFNIFFLSSVPLFLVIPLAVEKVATTGGVVPLAMFYGSTLLIYSFFGAGYATTPAYEADLFGQKYCGAIHGMMLTASASASVLGPLTITALRSRAEISAIRELTQLVDPEAFYRFFKAPLTDLDQLIAAKTVTINKLMAIVPPGTVDPTPFLYNTTMYSAAGLLVIGLVANLTIRPLDPKFMEPESVATIALEEVPKFTYCVALDDGESSIAAFNYVLNTMDREKHRLVLVAADLPHVHAFHQPHWPSLMEDLHPEKRAMLRRYMTQLEGKGIDFSALMIIGPNIGDALVLATKLKKADMLVLGSAHKKGLQILGTISKYVADRVECNLMFVKPKPNELLRHDETENIPNDDPEDWARIHEEKSQETVQSSTFVYQYKPKK